MRIDKKGRLNIEVGLSWEDWGILERGGIIGGRYDAENKVLIHRTHPFDPNDYGSKLESLKQREYAELDRVTMDIEIYIPHGVLRDARISASRFNETIGNLVIIPKSEFCEGADIRVSYPGSLRVLDIPISAPCNP
jgi:hypothetical protein